MGAGRHRSRAEDSDSEARSSSDPRWRRRWHGAVWRRFRKGLPGWRDDFDRAMAIVGAVGRRCRNRPIITYKYAGIPRGVFLADDDALREIESALTAGRAIERRHGDCFASHDFRNGARSTTARIADSGLRHSARAARNVHRGTVRIEHRPRSSMPTSRATMAERGEGEPRFSDGGRLARRNGQRRELTSTSTSPDDVHGGGADRPRRLRRSSQQIRAARCRSRRIADGARARSPCFGSEPYWLEARGDETAYRDLRDRTEPWRTTSATRAI